MRFVFIVLILLVLFTATAFAGRPYGQTVSVTDVAATVTVTDSNSVPARWCIITNRAGSANTFDIAWNLTTFVVRLPIGASITVGSANGNSTTSITNFALDVSTASGTATAEVTCGN